MASKELKGRYDAIFDTLEKDKKELLKKLKKVTGSSDCEKELLTIFDTESTIYEILDTHFDEILQTNETYKFKYHDIFDDKKFFRQK